MVKAFVLVSVVVIGMAAGMTWWQASERENWTTHEQLGWMLEPATSLSPDTRTVDVLFIEPDCGFQGKLHTIVKYRPNEVDLGLLLDHEPNCLMSGGTAHVRFDLTEPPGNRRVEPLDQPNLTLEDFAVPAPPPTSDPAFERNPRL